jgi:predicted metalloprotease with PDZ domain
MPHYSLTFADPAGHLLDITMTLPSPVAGQRVAMPSWIPGSYLMREFARHVVTLSAQQSGREIRAEKIDKATWQLACTPDAPVTVSYRVYAWDRSVRGCYFDSSRGFVNPAAALLQDISAPQAACTLDLKAPAFSEGHAWRCATSMTATQIDARGFGQYRAETYDELIDHPLECADFDEFTFEAGGVPHRFVISGKHRGDLERLKADSQKICQGHCDLFGDPVAPFDRYVFQLHVVDDGYGGLEHRASTALICPRNDLPAAGDASISEGYRELLGLISHEYFHAWNVKRIKPAAFTPYDTTRENYTSLLWIFEGFTSYYDELMLKRVGLITEADYLKIIGRRLTSLLRAPGTKLQSTAEASFDAWIKYYRADENAANSQFSYYLRGSFVALALDLALRADDSAHSLDDVMRGLWRDYGKTGIGLPEDPFAVISGYAGRDVSPLLEAWVNGTVDPDWSALFAPFGVAYRTRVSASAADRGGRDETTLETNTRTLGLVMGDSGAGLPVIKVVLSGSSAWRAGLSAGDTLIAVDGLRANATTLSKLLARFKAGTSVPLSYFRHDLLRETTVTVPTAQQATPDSVWLPLDGADLDAAGRRQKWLSPN